MPLEFQLVQSPLRFGLAEDVDPHHAPFGTLMTAENCVWRRRGRLEKRYGTTALSTSILGGGSISLARRLIVRGDDLALTDGTNLYSYNSTSGWIYRGDICEVGLESETATAPLGSVQASDVAYLSNGRVVEAWVTGDPSGGGVGEIYYQIRDVATGAVIQAPALIDTTTYPRVRVLGNGTSWIVLWMTSAGNLKCYTTSGATTLKTDGSTTTILGLDAYVQGSDFVVGYTLAAGGVRLVRYSFVAVPVQAATSTVTGETSTTINGLSIDGAAGESVYIVLGDQTNARVRFATADPSTMVQVTAPVTLQADAGSVAHACGVVRTSSTTCTAVYSYYSTTYQTARFRAQSVTNAGTASLIASTTGLILQTKPFALGGRFYVGVRNSLTELDSIADPVQSTGDTFLLEVSNRTFAPSRALRQVAKIDVTIGARWGFGHVSKAVAVSSTEVLIHTAYKTSVEAQDLGTQGARLVTMTVGASVPVDMWRGETIGPETYLTGGANGAYDGAENYPMGWAYGPNIDRSSTVNSTVGGTILAGTYVYNVTAERRSAVGILHRSPIGVAKTYTTTGSTSRITLGLFVPYFSPSTVSFGIYPIYRSVAGGSVAQRITMAPNYETIGDVSLGYPGSYPATVVDDDPDAAIGIYGNLALATRPALYTEGGELEDMQAPGALTSELHQGRLWFVAHDAHNVWFSKDTGVDPTIAPGFHPSLRIYFDYEVTALKRMDDKLAVFGVDQISVVIGQGPAPTGDGGSYEAIPVQTDVGCISPRSVVSVPDGIMFQSERGIYLLTRSLEVVFLGRTVQDQLVTYPTITSAVLVAKRNEVRFTANNTGGTAGISLAYNYVEKQWSTARYTVGGVYGAPIADACLWQGDWTFVTPGGVVVFEDDTKWLDGSTWVPLLLETAWYDAVGPLAYQSVRDFSLEGIANSHHDLTVSVGFNTDAMYTQTKTFVAGSPVTSPGPFESLEISIGTRRKCQAIRFKIQDATPTNPGTYPVGTGQGPSFDTLGIEVGAKKGFARRPVAQTG